MKNLIIVGGTAGVGKTTTCRELQKILPRNVFLDGDWCWDMRPFVVTEETKAMVESNIAHLLNGFLACSELENVIFCWVIHEQSILDNLINSLNLNSCASHCFSLVSTERALIERISRDIAAGKRDSDTIERSVARIPLYDKLNTVKIDVSTISPADAAQCIAEHVAGVQVPVTTAPPTATDADPHQGLIVKDA
jgi:adenylate kinase family enzyme